MQPIVHFRAHDGAVLLQGPEIVLTRSMAIADAEAKVAPWVRSRIDHPNGHGWLNLDGLLLGGYPCGMAMGFFETRLQRLHWSIALPTDKAENDWPTREAVDAEIRVMRGLLAEAFGRPFRKGRELFGWGEVWAMFDPKGFQASAGLRYAD